MRSTPCTYQTECSYKCPGPVPKSNGVLCCAHVPLTTVINRFICSDTLKHAALLRFCSKVCRCQVEHVAHIAKASAIERPNRPSIHSKELNVFRDFKRIASHRTLFLGEWSLPAPGLLRVQGSVHPDALTEGSDHNHC